MLEKAVKNKIKELLKRWIKGAWHYMPVQMGFGQHGIPDHIICMPVQITEGMVGEVFGQFVAIEAKAENGKLTKYQAMQLRGIRQAGGLAYVAHGVDGAKRVLADLQGMSKK